MINFRLKQFIYSDIGPYSVLKYFLFVITTLRTNSEEQLIVVE